MKNVKPEEFDLVILGGGTGSTIAAWTFAAEGKRVDAIDRKYIGGSCPNIACMPSKNEARARGISYRLPWKQCYVREHFRRREDS
jgi:pyruvate/2-oxoglutarate dehydrogenase complex dihydrolipoamide dehydrogenase (E3) component